MKPVEITDDNFEAEVIKSDKPVLIDFWAVWCGPCKLIAPIVEELATEYEGKVKIGKLDVDSNQQTSIKFGVRSIPTLLLFKEGKLKDTIIGAVPKSKTVEKLNAILPLARRGRTYTGQVNTGGGKHSYVIVVFGHEGEKWEAVAESPSAKNKHMGHMSPGGWDTFNTTSIEV